MHDFESLELAILKAHAPEEEDPTKAILLDEIETELLSGKLVTRSLLKTGAL